MAARPIGPNDVVVNSPSGDGDEDRAPLIKSPADGRQIDDHGDVQGPLDESALAPEQRMVARPRANTRRTLGIDEGVFVVQSDFDSPLPPHVLALFVDAAPLE